MHKSKNISYNNNNIVHFIDFICVLIDDYANIV